MPGGIIFIRFCHLIIVYRIKALTVIPDTQDQILDVIDEYEERIDDLESEVFDEEYYDEDIDEPLTCPECGAELDFDELDIDESVKSFKCPECGTKIDIEWLDDDETEE